MVNTDNIQEHKQEAEKEVASVINTIFSKGAEVHLHTSLEAADDEHTGIYASAFIHTPSITRQQQSQLHNHGLHLVEQFAHITENPDLDDSISEIPREKLDSAAETDLELILELDQEFLNSV